MGNFEVQMGVTLEKEDSEKIWDTFLKYNL